MIFNKQTLDMLVIPRMVAEQLLAGEPEILRVYLYGLLHEEGEPEQISEALGIERSVLLQALETLQAQGLIAESKISGELRYQIPQQTEPAEAIELYKDAGLNHMLQALFSDRELSYADYKTFYELMDIYGLPAQVLLLLAEYCINNSSAGNRVSMAYIKKVGRSWAKEGVDSIETAQRKIAALKRNTAELRELLASLNILRLPTDQEFQLYEKWVSEWGFSFGAIKAAMAATTNAQYPTLKYLDGILKNLYQQGCLSSVQVQEYFALNEKLDEQIKEVLRALSYARLTVSQEQRNRYLKFIRMGFGQEEILLACAQAAGKSSAGFDYVEQVLTDWQQRGLLKEVQIRAYLETERKQQSKVRKMLDAAGYKKRVSRGDTALYEKFSQEYGFADEVILFAASCAIGSSSPLRAMDTMLLRWKEAGVHNLRQAKEANEEFRRRGRKTSNFSDIDSRSYSEEQLAQLVPDPTLQYEE